MRLLEHIEVDNFAPKHDVTSVSNSKISPVLASKIEAGHVPTDRFVANNYSGLDDKRLVAAIEGIFILSQ